MKMEDYRCKANSSDYRGRSYMLRVMKRDRLVTHHTRHIFSNSITTEQYLWKQTKKGTGQLGGILMQTVQVE